jgi:hypothetical protein
LRGHPEPAIAEQVHHVGILDRRSFHGRRV